MKRKNYIIILATFILFLIYAIPSYSCVGRVLILGLSDSPDQVVVGELLATLINERTGTTVEIVKPGDQDAVHKAMLEGKSQIYINYLGSAKKYVEGIESVTDPNELFAKIRQAYIDKFGFVWLKPFGYNGPVGADDANASMAVPVTTKAVLKSFPVLDRVINKLGGQIDTNLIKELQEKAKDEDLKDVVKDYLKSRNMI